jgi:tripartite-type tricarboxylate transporter receptor subunit TctC
MTRMAMCMRFLVTPAILALMATCAHGQSYPMKPVRLIATSPPGGSQDFLARLLAQHLSPRLGQQMIVENRTGASGAIGIEHVAKAAPDGYTLLLGAAGPLTLVPVFNSRLPFDPVRDFSPITLLASGPFAVALHPSVPARSLKALIALAKGKPGVLNYGSSGTGASPHLAAELFKSMARIDMVHIPYKGVGPAMTDLLGGQIDLMFADVHLVVAHTRSERLRTLAVTGSMRSSVMPELPTVSESGIAGYAAGTWFGVLAPAGTPREIVDRLNGEIVKLLGATELQKRLLAQGIEPGGNTPDEFAALVRNEIAKWRKVAKTANIKVE